MGWLISVLGAVLALAGAASLANGISYLRMDWGATEVMAGTMALAGGLVTFALGAVLFALRDLSRRTAEAASPARSGFGMEVLAKRDAAAPDESRPAAMARVTSRLARVGVPKPEPALVPIPAEATQPDRARDLDEHSDPGPMMHRPVPEPGLRASLPADDEPEPVLESDSVPPATVLADAPTVVGRYEANGASYVLFSDGTIEVETASGTHRFSSMAQLKDHIERQEGG